MHNDIMGGKPAPTTSEYYEVHVFTIAAGDYVGRFEGRFICRHDAKAAIRAIQDRQPLVTAAAIRVPAPAPIADDFACLSFHDLAAPFLVAA